MADINVESVLSRLTLEEKASLTAGRDFWHTVPISRLGIPSLRTSDGPNGVRGTRFFNGTPSACLPCSTALGATFDTDLLRAAGRFLGEECKAKGTHILLGPTINIQRGPLGGRGFESFSEDPYLSGTLAGEYCKGVHEEHIISTPKHFVCNDQEHERMAVNSIVTERALREIYLMPFMLAIKNSSPSAVMTAYNKVNGTHVAENKDIINILRVDWGWKGLLMSDWFGTYSTSEGVNAGQDLEMPGPTRWRGDILIDAVKYNKVRATTLDDRVREVLKAIKMAAKSGIHENANEEQLNRPKDKELLRRLAAESTVLLKNEGDILPLDKRKSVAVIGPNAKIAAYSGGGSASLLPYYTVNPFEGVSNQCKDVRFSQGAYGHKALPLLGEKLRTADGRCGFLFQAYDKPPENRKRQVLDTLHLTKSDMFFVDYKILDVTFTELYVHVEGIFSPDEDGLYDFGLTVQGKGKLLIDGSLLIDNTSNQTPGTAFFGQGTIEEIGSIQLAKGQSYTVSIEFWKEDGQDSNFRGGGIRVGCCRRIDPVKAIKEAAVVASKADQVVVFAGLNSDWESESFDRPDMRLPEYTDELIRNVLAVKPDAVIVIQSGTPVELPWADEARSILHAWYGGNETGNGIADVLFGDCNPSAKLPLSFPRQLSDNPTYLNWGSERGRVLYGEDVYVGYRYYDKVGRGALFPFGHGLSYTSFSLTKLRVTKAEDLLVKLSVRNTGQRDGAEVIQVYITQEKPSIQRPPKELKGFKKVFLKAGETKEVEVKMEMKYATSFWDEGRDAWIMEKGGYRVLVGNSSRCDFLEKGFEVETTQYWTGI